MLIRYTHPPMFTPVDGPVTPLNALWPGAPTGSLALPQTGHLLLIFPQGGAFSAAGHTLRPDEYLLLAPPPAPAGVTLAPLDGGPAHCLVLWLSPPFIADMAAFLNIPDNLRQLLSGAPLLQGDALAATTAELAAAARAGQDDSCADLFLEVVGDVLRLMRLRHLALQRLAPHRPATVADLLPRLLTARQFIAARYAQSFTTAAVAAAAGLSEFHFSRLFKTAFDISPRQYVIRQRLDAARHLLEDPEATVTAVALDVGYGSLSSFIHAFTGRFGLSPARYQARRIEQDLTSRADRDRL